MKLAPNYNCSSNGGDAPVSLLVRQTSQNNKLLEDVHFSITPNPANDVLHIQCAEPIISVALFNINGQCVLQATQTQINISHLPHGVYVVRVITEDGKNTQSKIIH